MSDLNFKFYFLLLHCVSLFQVNQTTKVKHFSLEVFEENQSLSAVLDVPSLWLQAVLNLTSLSTSGAVQNQTQIQAVIRGPLPLNAVATINISKQVNEKDKDYSYWRRHLDVHGSLTSPFLGKDNISFDSNLKLDFLDLNNLEVESQWNFTDGNNEVNDHYNYSLHFKKSGSCPQLFLVHNLTSSENNQKVYFSSNLTDSCRSPDDTSSRQINITLNSKIWQLLNLELRQIFKFENLNHGKGTESDGGGGSGGGGSEVMKAEHPLLDIEVVANWDNKKAKTSSNINNTSNSNNSSSSTSFVKKAKFKSKALSLMPSFSLEYQRGTWLGENVEAEFLVRIEKGFKQPFCDKSQKDACETF